MNYYAELLSRIKTAASTTEVASAASISASDWSSLHVFDGGRSYIGGQNRGRVPFVNIWRVDSDYSFDALSVSDLGGQVDSRWQIEVVVGKSSNSNEATNETQAYAITQKIIKNIRLDYNLSIGNEKIGQVANHPFGMSLVTDITIQNTHSNSEK